MTNKNRKKQEGREGEKENTNKTNKKPKTTITNRRSRFKRLIFRINIYRDLKKDSDRLEQDQ